MNFLDFPPKNRLIIREILGDDFKIKPFTEKYEFLLLSFMLLGSPPELFLATHTSNINFSSDQLATFLTKLFHKVLME